MYAGHGYRLMIIGILVKLLAMVTSVVEVFMVSLYLKFEVGVSAESM